MKTGKTWQQIAERLAESGWSWEHREIVRRNEGTVHIADARNDEGERHGVAADAIGPAFAVLEQSIQKAAQK